MDARAATEHSIRSSEVAQAECGHLGRHAVRHAQVPWQMVCHPALVRWLINLVESEGWLTPSNIMKSSGGPLAGGLDADDVHNAVNEMVRLGWLIDAVKKLPARVETWRQYRATPLLGHLLKGAAYPWRVPRPTGPVPDHWLAIGATFREWLAVASQKRKEP